MFSCIGKKLHPLNKRIFRGGYIRPIGSAPEALDLQTGLSSIHPPATLALVIIFPFRIYICVLQINSAIFFICEMNISKLG